MISVVSTWVVPGLLAIVLLTAMLRKVDLFQSFTRGAEDGVRLGVSLIPFLLGIYVAIGAFRASGAFQVLADWVAPLTTWVGLPGDLLPLLIVRPLSHGASLGVISEILQVHGPDSFIGRLSTVILGSSETTFYVLTVYLGSVAIRYGRYALFLCLFGDFIGFLSAVWITNWYFGH